MCEPASTAAALGQLYGVSESLLTRRDPLTEAFLHICREVDIFYTAEQRPDPEEKCGRKASRERHGTGRRYQHSDRFDVGGLPFLHHAPDHPRNRPRNKGNRADGDRRQHEPSHHAHRVQRAPDVPATDDAGIHEPFVKRAAIPRCYRACDDNGNDGPTREERDDDVADEQPAEFWHARL